MNLPLDQGGDWIADAGTIDTGKLQHAIEVSRDCETTWPRDIATALAEGTFEPPPWNEVLGPTRPRGRVSGLILKDGRLVAEWGTPQRVDMTFSVAKSYLSILAGLAVADGLIADIDRPVAELVDDGGFEGNHNGAITWRHLLQQTSEWSGTLWSKPDQVDHFRTLGGGLNEKKGQKRDLSAPGGYWEYNDVRVNRLSLSLMRVFKRPLPAVLKERVMDPIGATESWSWNGYGNAGEIVDGRFMVGVPGGSHWGGGLWMSTRDHARVGQMIAQGGQWNGQQILPASWIEQMTTPCELNPTYGFLWWLNTDRAYLPAASGDAFFAIGAGMSMIWIDPRANLVVVLRWIDGAHANEVVGAIAAAVG